jgi:hypothetical protein
MLIAGCMAGLVEAGRGLLAADSPEPALDEWALRPPSEGALTTQAPTGALV